MVMSSKKIGKMVGADVGKALANINASAPKPDMKDAGAELKAAVAPKKAQTFGEAFRAARKDPEAMKRGNFTFGGKSFSTKMAGEGASKPASSGRSGTGSSGVSAATDKFFKRLPTIGSTVSGMRGNASAQGQRPKMDTRFLGAKTTSAPAPAKKDAFTARLESKGAPKPQPTRAERMKAESLKNVAAYAAKKKAEADKERAAQTKRANDLKRGFRAATKGQAPLRAMAKGGKVDGCAIRGKTRAPMKKGK